MRGLRFLNVLSGMVLTGLYGCGGAPGGGGTTQQGPLPEGTFLGASACETTVAAGTLSDRFFESRPASVNVSENGSISLGGDEIKEGATIDSSVGSVTNAYAVDSVDETSNGVRVSGRYSGVWDCGDSCFGFNFDGVCDEITFCALGTDCFDCGPIELSGEFSITFRDNGDGSIEFVSGAQSGDPQGFIFINEECVGTLD